MSTPDPMRRITIIKKAKGISPGYQVKIYPANSNSRNYYSKFFLGLDEASLVMAKSHRDIMEEKYGIDPNDSGIYRPRKKYAGNEYPGVQIKIEDRKNRLYAYVVAVKHYRDAETNKTKKVMKAYNITKLGLAKAYAFAVKTRCDFTGFQPPESLVVPELTTKQVSILNKKGCDMDFILQPYIPTWIKK